MNFFRKLYRIGLVQGEHPLSDLRTSMTNLVIIVTVPFILSYFPLFIRLGHIKIMFVYLLLIIALSGGLYLNYKRHKKWATRLVFVCGSIMVFIPVLSYGRNSELQSIYPILVVFVFIFFDKKSEIFLATLLVITLFLTSFILLEFRPPLISESVFKFDYFTNMFFSIFACGCLSFVMMKRLKSFLKQNQKADSELTKQNDIINIQKSEMELFTLMASHDLKTPTRTITSYLGLLEKTEEIKSTAAKEYLRMALSGATQLNNLIDGITEFRSPASSKKELKYVSTDIVLSRVLDSNGILEDNSISIDVKVNHNIKIPDTELFHIIQKLIQNSIKYNNSKIKKIEISSQLSETHIELIFKDNGIGIEKEYLEYIFELFKKLNASDKYRSTGLGLSTCKKILSGYGSSIRAESEGLGKGSTFILSFPMNLLMN